MIDINNHNDKQFKVIEKILHKRNSPTILWITCNDYFYRGQLINIFKSRFLKHQHQELSLKKFSENSFKSFFKNNLQSNYLSTDNIHKIVHLIDVESCIYPHIYKDNSVKNSKEHFIRTLNFEREILFNDLPFFIVFWSDTQSMKQVQRYAPDFYDWISYKFNFEYNPEKVEQEKSNEVNYESSAYVGNENVIYNRISRRLNTLETVENINDRFTLLFSIAIDYNSVNDFNKAERIIEELLKFKELPIERIASVKLLQANTFFKLSKLNEAECGYEEALKIYRNLAKENPRTYLPDVAMTLNNLANLQKNKNEFPEALEKYEEALKIRRSLAKENPRTYLPDVATTLNNLAILQKNKNEFPEALEKYEEALNIYRSLTKENPRTYLPDVAMTLNNLANLHFDKNEFPEALEKYEEALKIRRSLTKENPRTYLPDVATTLNNLANLQKNKNEFPEALEKYEEALNIYRSLTKENPRTYLPDVATTLNNLAILQKNKNEFPEALEKYEEALKIYRSLAKENPRTYLPDIAMTLNNLANLHFKKNEFPEALKKYEEALNIYKNLYKENQKRYEINYAHSLIIGVYLFKKKQSNLDISEKILNKYQHVPYAVKLINLINEIRSKQ